LTYERCGCGAAIFTLSAKRADAWRTTHIHEIQAQDSYPEPTMVVESSARVESALPFGFTLEMEGDLS
jgi:hypothetical protein